MSRSGVSCCNSTNTVFVSADNLNLLTRCTNFYCDFYQPSWLESVRQNLLIPVVLKAVVLVSHT